MSIIECGLFLLVLLYQQLHKEIKYNANLLFADVILWVYLLESSPA